MKSTRGECEHYQVVIELVVVMRLHHTDSCFIIVAMVILDSSSVV